uniref:Uncharacterized protein n=1 Tax=Anguilla anguilla TaxID=7936 RepID=A0A0E9XYV2_ANGAN
MGSAKRLNRGCGNHSIEFAPAFLYLVFFYELHITVVYASLARINCSCSLSLPLHVLAFLISSSPILIAWLLVLNSM